MMKSPVLEYFFNLYGAPMRRPHLLRVLTYHRIGEPAATPHLNPTSISATPRVFDQHMQYLSRHYRVVSMAEVLAAIAGERRLPGRAVLITFDDACVDFKEIAWPRMKKYGLPATVFVPTAYPNHPERMFWWDKLYRSIMYSRKNELHLPAVGVLSLQSPEARQQSLRRVQNHFKMLSNVEAITLVEEISANLNGHLKPEKTVLDWEELRQLAKEGVTLGPHTQTHPILTQIPLPEVRKEVLGSMQDLQREIGPVLPIFAYPNGNNSAEIRQILREAGIKAAFSMLRGFNNLDTEDPLGLRRVNITQKTTVKMLQWRLKKSVSFFDLWQHRVKMKLRHSAKGG